MCHWCRAQSSLDAVSHYVTASWGEQPLDSRCGRSEGGAQLDAIRPSVTLPRSSPSPWCDSCEMEGVIDGRDARSADVQWQFGPSWS